MNPMDIDGRAGGAAERPLNTADLLAAGVAAGNIYRQAADAEVMDLPEVSYTIRHSNL